MPDPEVYSPEEPQPLILVPVTAEDAARKTLRSRLTIAVVIVAILALAGFIYKRSMDPINAKASLDAGTRLFKIARYNQAILSFDRAIALKPDLVDAYLLRGRSFVGENQPERALPDFSKVIELHATDPTGWVERGSAYLELNKFDAAVADASQAIVVDPKYARAYNLRGFALRKKGETQKALDDFNRAVALDANADNLFQRGATYQGMGQHRQAIADFDQVIRMIPDLASPYFSRAESRRAIGDTAGAKQDHKQGRILDGH